MILTIFSQSSVPLLEGPRPTEAGGSDEHEDNSNSPAIINDEASSSAVDLGHFALPPDSALKIIPLVNQDDAEIKNSIKDTLSTITKSKDVSKTADGGIIPSSTDEDIHSDFHSSADSHFSSNPHSDVNPFKRYMSQNSLSSINRNEPIYVETRDTTTVWLVSIVTIILSGIVAFVVTKAANRNGVVQVLSLLFVQYHKIITLPRHHAASSDLSVLTHFMYILRPTC